MSSVCAVQCAVGGDPDRSDRDPEASLKACWGHVTWRLLHAYAESGESDAASVANVIGVLAGFDSDWYYPCAQCRASLRGIWEVMNSESVHRGHEVKWQDSEQVCQLVDSRCSTRYIASRVTKEHLVFLLHNEVNRNLHRDLWTVEVYNDNRWRYRRSPDSVEVDAYLCKMEVTDVVKHAVKNWLANLTLTLEKYSMNQR